MAKISINGGVTLHIGQPEMNEYIRLGVEISGIDTELDLEDQLSIAKPYVERVYDEVMGKLEEQIQLELNRHIQFK